MGSIQAAILVSLCVTKTVPVSKIVRALQAMNRFQVRLGGRIACVEIPHGIPADEYAIWKGWQRLNDKHTQVKLHRMTKSTARL